MVSQNAPIYGRNPCSFDEFDALPSPVRRVIAFACIELGTRRARMNLLSGRSVEEVCALERRVDRLATRKMLLADYGPDHPSLSRGRPHGE